VVRVVPVRDLVAALVTSAILLAGCGTGETTTAPQPGGQVSPPAGVTPSHPTEHPPTSAPATPDTRGTVVKTASSQFGEVLFDGTGQAIYLFDKEKTTTPECYGGCAEAWPPVLTEGAPVGGTGARADALGTTKRTDGAIQVTYAGHPLYYYAHEGRNQVRCHNVREFGGLWLAITPRGNAAAH
jgi:predicted lipoprotein with Yx(FWY)xxD motif